MRSAMAVALLAIICGLQPAQRAPALTGIVLLPDGSPASVGTVIIQSPSGYGGNARIGARGEFRCEPAIGATYDVRASVPGFIARPIRVDFSKRSDVALPAIHLLPEPYVRARILSPTGELITLPQILGGPLFPFSRGDATRRLDVRMDPDGQATRIGPLPYGTTMLTIDQLPYARMQLQPIQVAGEVPIIDLGTITLQPGATIDATIVDESGSPVRGHTVYLTQTITPAPLMGLPVMTGVDGHAVFSRLAAGTYLVRTHALRLCGLDRSMPGIERSVRTADSGTASVTINAGGFPAHVRVRWGGLPLGSARVALTPQITNAIVRDRLGDRYGLIPLYDPALMVETGCNDVTDAKGTVTVANVPAGHARVAIAIVDSVWGRRVEMLPRESTFSFDVPSGVVAVRAVNAATAAPIDDAIVIAASAGARIETRTGADGSAMIQGVGDGAFGLEVRAGGYRRAERSFELPPDTLQEIGLLRDPDRSLSCYVVNSETRRMLSEAAVAFEPQDPLEPVRVVVTRDAETVTIGDLPQGTVRITASHDGYVSTTRTVMLPLSDRRPVVLTLAPATPR